MRDVQKPDHLSLNSLVTRLKEGRFVIPDFQRDFEWKPWDIRELVKSIFLDYYIGSLLLWKGKKENFDALSCEVIYGFDNTAGEIPWTYDKGQPEYIILDGQQRLTAMYYAFISPKIPLPKRSTRAVYFINVDKFINEKYDEAFQYDWLSKRFKRILSDPEIQYSEHFFPLSIIGSGGWDLANWVQGYEDYWKKRYDKANENGDVGESQIAQRNWKNADAFGKHLKGITGEYQIAYIELDKDLAVEKVCDIFTQINSKGVRLDVFDLMNALLKPKGLQLKHMWREASKKLYFVDTKKMNVYILQVMSILLQNYCSPKYLYYLLPGQEKKIKESDGTIRKEILIDNINDFEKIWNRSVNILESAIKLLRSPHEYGVTSSNYLPYISILPAFAAIQFAINDVDIADRLVAQTKFRHWYWASVFTNRYSGSVESTIAKDFIDMKKWFVNDENKPSLIQEFRNRYQDLDLKKQTKRGTSIYNGIFNLLVIHGARDWISGNIPQPEDIDDHHIVPSSWGKKHIKNNLIHTILNRTPLTSESNRNIIKDRLPNQYLPEMMRRSGENEVKKILSSHFISENALEILLRKPFTIDDYEEFILERQRTIKEAIENLLIKERLDLPPKLRELDEDIEDIELKMRDIILNVCENNISLIPQHINQKVKERIKKAAQKNAAFEISKYEKFEGILEFFDLREIQDLIVSKSLWDRFKSRFSNKEVLNQKFDQLAELRNSIRHSRAVDAIVQKEGEAAILWFNKVLKK